MAAEKLRRHSNCLPSILEAVRLFSSASRAAKKSSASLRCLPDGIIPTVASCYLAILHLRGTYRNSNLAVSRTDAIPEEIYFRSRRD